jgi:hypothetical protein
VLTALPVRPGFECIDCTQIQQSPLIPLLTPNPRTIQHGNAPAGREGIWAGRVCAQLSSLVNKHRAMLQSTTKQQTWCVNNNDGNTNGDDDDGGDDNNNNDEDGDSDATVQLRVHHVERVKW